MEDFNNRFEQLLNDIHQIKLDSSDEKSEVKILSARLNGTVEKMNKHLDETDDRQKALDRLWLTIVLQIVAFAFFLGGIVWMVRNDNKTLESMTDNCDRFKEHIIKDEARWELYKSDEYTWKGEGKK